MKTAAKKINIAFFMTNTHFRGGVISLYYILKHLDRDRYDPVFITCSGGEHVDRIRGLGVEVEIFKLPQGFLAIGRNRLLRDFVKNLAGIFLAFYAVLRIVFFLKKRKISLVHTQDQKSMVLGVIAGVLSRTPVICHVRDIPYGAANMIDQAYAIFAKRIIAISSIVAEPFHKNPFLKGKVLIVYNGFDPEIFSPAVDGNPFRASAGLKDKFIVGQAASLIPLKGLEYFIEAAKILSRSNFKGVFVVIGDNKVAQYRGYDEKLRRMVAEAGLEDRFRFLEFSSQIEWVMAGLDLFVFTSVGDGFGKVLVEAMGMKKPVVAFDLGANREIIEHGRTGVLVPSRDPAALAQAIEELAKDDDLRDRVAEGGYRKALEAFDVRNAVRKMEVIYSNTLGEICAESAGL